MLRALSPRSRYWEGQSCAYSLLAGHGGGLRGTFRESSAGVRLPREGVDL